jgi:hypothetical protein
LGLSEEELYQRLRDGALIAYRAHVGDHWEWRVDPADQTQQEAAVQPVGIEAASEEVE